MRDGGLLPDMPEPALLSGYNDIVALPPDYRRRVRFKGVLLTVQSLAYALSRSPVDRSIAHQTTSVCTR
jgi:hypothetical protein